MKKVILLLWVLVMCSLGCHGMSKFVLGKDLSAIAKGWHKKTVPVVKDGENPDIMELLIAFNRVWPSQAVETLIAKVGNKKFYTTDMGDGDIYMDCEDFNCASYNGGDKDGQRMMSRLYRRENGHTLFVICLELANRKQTQFACFYDYNPQTTVMTPEAVPFKEFKPQEAGSSVEVYSLGSEYDQEILLKETTKSGDTIFHHLPFNGMMHQYDHSGDEVDPEDDFQEMPEEAVLKYENSEAALYINQDVEGSESRQPQYSVWLKDKKSGEVKLLFTTNNDAESKWSQMKHGNGTKVTNEEIAAGDCDKCQLIPWDKNKVYVEGCPDSRNVWSYIYDIPTKTAILLPSTQGILSIDATKRVFHMSLYRYHPEGGRYSVERLYDVDGKYLGVENQLTDED